MQGIHCEPGRFWERERGRRASIGGRQSQAAARGSRSCGEKRSMMNTNCCCSTARRMSLCSDYYRWFLGFLWRRRRRRSFSGEEAHKTLLSLVCYRTKTTSNVNHCGGGVNSSDERQKDRRRLTTFLLYCSGALGDRYVPAAVQILIFNSIFFWIKLLRISQFKIIISQISTFISHYYNQFYMLLFIIKTFRIIKFHKKYKLIFHTSSSFSYYDIILIPQIPK